MSSWRLPRVLGRAASLGLVVAALIAPVSIALSEEGRTYKIAWSSYPTWLPFGHMAQSGVLDAWSERYGVDVEMVLMEDYSRSLQLYSAGLVDGVVATNIDALEIASQDGLDSTAVLITDFSNGADGVVTKEPGDISVLEGREIYLMTSSVSHYILARCLEMAGVPERAVRLVHTPHPELAETFAAPETFAIAARNPLVTKITDAGDGFVPCYSADLPGEIIGMLIMRTETLLDRPEVGYALAGAWYETVAPMSEATYEGEAMRVALGEMIGVSGDEFDVFLEQTRIFYTLEEARIFQQSPALRNVTLFVRRFLYNQGLLGDSVRSMNDIGIDLGNGYYIGDPTKLLLRYDLSFADEVAAPE